MQMKHFFYLSLLFLLTISIIHAKSDGKPNLSGSISGKVFDYASGESLAAVRIQLVGTSYVTYSDAYGNFHISGLQTGKYSLSFQLISYNIKIINEIDVISFEKSSYSVHLEPSDL
jgi:hypothetical protein